MSDHATTRPPSASTSLNSWTIQTAAAHYGLDRWGKDYFSINKEGELCVHPDRKSSRCIPLNAVLEQAITQGMNPPLLLRFEDSIKDRINLLAQTFQEVITQRGYRSNYRLAYPIKVNQQAEVIQQIIKHGQPHHFGLEAGSKAEFMAILGLSANTSTPIFCNGFKDQAYIHSALLAHQLGRSVTIIIEKAHEAALIAQACAAFKTAPTIGLRIKLHTQATGHWSESGGQRSKFGLRYDEVPEVLAMLSRHDLTSQVRLLHAHGGSQISDLDDLRSMCLEMTRIYCDLQSDLPSLDQLDLGGGLGVNYDGSPHDSHDSVNYTLEDYAHTLIQTIQSTCDQQACEHPTLITESGRFLVAHHSLLLVNLLPTQSMDSSSESVPEPALPDELHSIKQQILNTIDPMDLEPLFNQIQSLTQTTQQDFINEKLSFQHSSTRLKQLRSLLSTLEQDPGISANLLARVQAILAPIAFANFSIFQSLPDSWALGQRFPIMPIQCLDQLPNQEIILGDLTCDSDGQINQFPGQQGIRSSLSIHRQAITPPGPHNPLLKLPYCLGIFLTGAYQEILGDMHNLFGDTHRIHLGFSADDQWEILETHPGEDVEDMLRYVEIDLEDLMNRLRTELDHARLQARLSPEQAEALLAYYQAYLNAYTYLDPPS